MTTPAAPAPLADKRLSLQCGIPVFEPQFLDQILAEHMMAKRELSQIQKTLRSLAPGFSKAGGILSRITGSKADSLLSPYGGNSLWGKAVNAVIFLCGYVFFKVRLTGLFRYITQDREKSPQAELIAEITRSGLFDSHYYLSQAPAAHDYEHGPIAHYIQFGRELNPHRLFDVQHFFSANSGVSPSSTIPPLLQYIRSTGREAYSPHLLFDARYYVDSNHDLQSFLHASNPLIHYLTDGKGQGRNPHPLFFNGYYMNQYGDDVRKSLLSPLEHFLLWGCTGKYNPNEVFDSAYYLSQLPYLKSTFANPLLHYLVADENSRACPHRLFDTKYYLDQIPDRNAARVNPLAHFVSSDAGRRSSPHPLFDIDFYLNEYPHIADENFHAFLHYLRLGEENGYSPNRFFYPNWFRVRYSKITDPDLSVLESYVKQPVSRMIIPHPLFDAEFYAEQNPELKDSDVDPLPYYFLTGKQKGISTCKRPILGSFDESQIPLVETRLDLSFRQLLDLAEEPFSHLFLIPGLQKGGAERAACNYIQYLQDQHGKDQVLVLSSLCEEHSCLDWLPDGARFVDIVKLNASLTWDDTRLLLACFVIEKKPQVTHVVNNYHYLQAMAIYRDLLERSSRHVIYMFGYDVYAPGGLSSVSSNVIRKSVGWADCVVADSKKLIGLVKEHLVERNSPEKVSECCYSASVSIDNLLEESMGLPPAKGKRVLWASRLAEPKRPDLLASIAGKLPHVEFVVYGSIETGGSKSDEYLSLLKKTANINYRGEFSEFSSIDRSDIGLFLYTSCSDGLPIVLLEAAASALPVIAPNVGGIPEFISNDTGWLIEKFDDVDAYCCCIEECLANPQLAAARAQRAQQLVRERHSQSAAQEQLNKLKDFF